MSASFPWLILVFAGYLVSANAQENLLPNGTFAGDPPSRGWVTAFPDEAWYKNNDRWVKFEANKAPGGHTALVLNLGPGIAGNQGGKIESHPVKVVPGATYKIQVDCMTWDFAAKLHAEVWTTDPSPDQKRTLFRRAARADLPPLIMCYRAQIPSPPAGAKSWSTAEREFTVPTQVRVAGKDQHPEYISVKAVAYAATMDAGTSYFANFRLFLVPTKKEKP